MYSSSCDCNFARCNVQQRFFVFPLAASCVSSEWWLPSFIHTHEWMTRNPTLLSLLFYIFWLPVPHALHQVHDTNPLAAT